MAPALGRAWRASRLLHRSRWSSPTAVMIAAAPLRTGKPDEPDAAGFASFGIRQYSNNSWEGVEKGLVNHERTGVPAGAGIQGNAGFDLGRMHRLLAALGDPHHSFPVVQVVGTKGKGSTAALLSNILRAAGYKVGTYTSPHVVDESERLWCGTAPTSLSPAELQQLQEKHSGVAKAAAEKEGGELSYFEVFTAMAFKHFQENQVDIAVVEAGLGGATDATNVFSASKQLMSIVTAVGTDHKDALGETISEIARTKAGILKDGRPVVLAAQPDAAAVAAVREVADEKGCQVIDCSQDVTVTSGGISSISGSGSGDLMQLCDIDIEVVGSGGSTGSLRLADVELRLLGAHQLLNVAAAVRASLELAASGWDKITAEAIRSGMRMTTLPGRFEVLSAQVGSTRHTLVLDVAHTPESAQAVVDTLREALPGRPVVMVIAMLEDKDKRGFMRAVRGAGPRVVIFTTGSGSGTTRYANSGQLSAAWQIASMEDRNPLTRRVRTRELVQASMEAALHKAMEEAAALEEGPGGGAVVCVTGSFTAVAAAVKTTAFQQHFRHSALRST